MLLLATAVAGYYAGNPFNNGGGKRQASASTTPGRKGGVRAAPPAPLPPIPGPNPGPATEVSSVDKPHAIALTVDDGYDAETVAAYIDFCHDSGIHLTFNPNGLYRRVWEPHAPELKALIANGQVQLGNHTYGHKDLRTLSPGAARSEILRNEEWIQEAFGVTSRPWLRPPYGGHNSATDEIAGSLGFTRILMWNGSLGDSRLLDAPTLLRQAAIYLQEGNIVLSHANHRTVIGLYGDLLSIIRSRSLRPGNLDELFGTSRRTG